MEAGAAADAAWEALKAGVRRVYKRESAVMRAAEKRATAHAKAVMAAPSGHSAADWHVARATLIAEADRKYFHHRMRARAHNVAEGEKNTHLFYRQEEFHQNSHRADCP